MKYIKLYENFNEDLTFENEYGEITYRFPEDRGEIFLYDEDYKNPIILDRIDVYEKGNGYGTILMREFISKMKSEGVDLIYLYATYDALDFDDTDQSEVDGHKRLINFYKKLGFEQVGPIAEYGEHIQVDMYLKL